MKWVYRIFIVLGREGRKGISPTAVAGACRKAGGERNARILGEQGIGRAGRGRRAPSLAEDWKLVCSQTAEVGPEGM